MLLGIGTAVPAFSAPQSQVCEFMKQALLAAYASRAERYSAFLEQIYAHSGIEKRYSVLQDYGCFDPRRFQFFPASWTLQPSPSTAKRMEVYETESMTLSLTAIETAFRQAGVGAQQITHVIINTCTGFFAPGPDVMLIKRLGLNPNVQRLIIGFMGCCAGFHGMRTAKQIVAANPDAVVLHINIELCSLHFQNELSRQSIIANSLFADGCAAVVYGSSRRFPNTGLEVMELHSALVPDCEDQMTWKISGTGFIMTLDAAVPKTIHHEAVPFLETLWRRAGIGYDDMCGWAIHPGGKKIVEMTADALSLDDHETACSYSVLRNYGNMSSATLFFVLDQWRQTHHSNGYITAMGFGPGLVMEGAVFKVYESYYG